MGKPYQSEIAKIKETYEWAVSLNNNELVRAIKMAAYRPLIAVGSGGSLSAAEFLVSFHQDFARSMGKAVTPQELVTSLPFDGNVSVWFLSASGRNIDIKRAYKHAILQEPNQVVSVVGRLGSPLQKISEKHAYVDCLSFDIPSGRDGFLATNSLLAFTTLLCNGYVNAFDVMGKLPLTVEALTKFSFGSKDFYSSLEQASCRLWERKVLHVIYSREFKAAAVDLESKLIEAGLMSVHLADYRNFSHGRHNWFDKHGEDSAILALTSPCDQMLSKKTLGLIPPEVPRVNIEFCSGNHLAKIASLIISLHLTGWVGHAKGIDPGRPGVPTFGRELYNLKAPSGFIGKIKNDEIIIERKIKSTHGAINSEQKHYWNQAYKTFCKKLSSVKFGGLVLDYDGTVVDTRKRYEPPEQDMADALNSLLDAGVLIGFATGRGKSIRDSLRAVIYEKHWSKVIVGYYNGSQILSLDECLPDGSSIPEGVLLDAQNAISCHSEISKISKITPRKTQITVEPQKIAPENLLWELVDNELVKNKKIAVNVFRSSHSIDVLCKNVSKTSVVNKIQSMMPGKDVLTIGDRGKWPGNDCELLGHKYSLSVDEVSCSEDTCWNLCPAGTRGVQGAMYYIQKMKIVNDSCFKVKF